MYFVKSVEEQAKYIFMKDVDKHFNFITQKYIPFFILSHLSHLASNI